MRVINLNINVDDNILFYDLYFLLVAICYIPVLIHLLDVIKKIILF